MITVQLFMVVINNMATGLPDDLVKPAIKDT